MGSTTKLTTMARRQTRMCRNLSFQHHHIHFYGRFHQHLNRIILYASIKGNSRDTDGKSYATKFRLATLTIVIAIKDVQSYILKEKSPFL